jgi:hypothetical protein
MCRGGALSLDGMAREIVKQPWRLGLIVFLLVTGVTGMLLLRALGDNSLPDQPTAVEVASGSTLSEENPGGNLPGTPPRNPAAATGQSTPLIGSTGGAFTAATAFSETAAPAAASYLSASTPRSVSSPRSSDPGQSSPPSVPQTGALSGIVTGAVRDCLDCPIKSMVPLSGITVYLVDSNARPTGATTVTGPGGQFRLSGLAPGGYNVYFEDPTGKYDSSWYIPETIVQADPVRILAGRETAIAMTLYPASGAETTGAISGHVQAGDGKSVSGVTVIAYWSELSAGEVLVLKAMAKTDASGNYLISGLPANEDGPGGSPKSGYKVLFAPGPGSGYPQQWYQSQSTHETAKLLSVGPGEEVQGIDAVLGEGSHISGTVRGGGLPLAGILVDIYDDTGVIVSSVMTDFSGGYRSGPLAAGSYRIHAAGNAGYTQEWYSDKTDFASADPVTVTSGAETSGIEMNLNAVGATAAVAAAVAAKPASDPAGVGTPLETAPVDLPDQTGDTENLPTEPGSDAPSGQTDAGSSEGTSTGSDAGTADGSETGQGESGTSTVPDSSSGGSTGGETQPPPGGGTDEPPLQCPTEEELQDPAWRARHGGPIDPRCPSEEGPELSTEAEVAAEQQQR